MAEFKSTRVGDFDVTINGISETTDALNSYYAASDLPEGAEFVTFDVTLSNGSEEEQPIGNLISFSLRDDEGNNCEYCVSDNADVVTMKPGDTSNFLVPYIAPKNVQLHFTVIPDLIKGERMDLPITF